MIGYLHISIVTVNIAGVIILVIGVLALVVKEM